MDGKLLDKLEALCSRSEHCSSDVRAKALKALQGDAAAADEIVAKLQSEGYVDDARYAAAFARDKAQLAGWGPSKISYMLRSKGIASVAIDAALKDIDSEKADEKMAKVLLAKYKVVKDDPQWRFKLIKFGLTRGYEYDSISKFLSEL